MLLIISAVRRLALLLLVTIIINRADAQNTVVLPGNGASSSLVAPQGSVRFQRQFYLVDSAEVRRSGLQSGMAINSIGFTIGARQDSITKGIFRVYLQNTSDTVSRADTNWTVVNQPENVYRLSGLSAGSYEWRVQSNCGSSSLPSALSTFKINSDTCKSPTHLATENITDNSATLRWIKPAYNIGSFKVEYSRTDTANWITAFTTDDFYNLSGLLPGKPYQWKVSSFCSTDSSDLTAVTFTTSTVNSCNPPSSLTVGARSDTTALVSWNAAAGATHYEINYRRSGTSNWFSNISFTTSVTLQHLAPGTNYEWQVKTVCGVDAYGAPVTGTAFSTTGTQACYPPENLYADSVTSSSVKLSWDVADDASSYQLSYRQKEFISWNNAIAPVDMILVHNDSLTIPNTAGPYNVNFAGGSSFTYSGKGLYIAFEYIDSTGALSTNNVSLANNQTKTHKYQGHANEDLFGRDSANIISSFGGIGTDTLPTVLLSTSYRPETRLGSNDLSDSVAVVAVYGLGHNPVPYGNPSGISALIRNFTSTDKSYAVTLTIKDTANVIKHTELLNATVRADSVLHVAFSGWSPAIIARDSLIVSIPQQADENVTNNNSNFYLQEVNNSILAYDDGSPAISSTGLDTATGLMLTRYSINGCGAVNSANIFLATPAKGRPVYAVVLNASGLIIASSSPFTPDSSSVNSYHSFYFSSPVPIDNNTDFYVGLAMPDSAFGYLPVGVQWEGTDVRAGAYYTAKLDGSELIDHPQPGRLMIRAEIIADSISPVINGNLTLCPSGNTILTAASITRRFANQVIGFSSEGGNNQFGTGQTLGTPNVYPQYNLSQNAWISSTADGQREYLILGFPNPDSVNFVDIYETYNPGAIDTVYVKNPGTDQFEVVYSNTVINMPDSVAKIKRISFPLTNFKVSEIRIALNSPADTGYNSIDAVAIGRVESATSFTSYQWTKQTGSGPVNIGTGTSVNISDSGRYTLTVTNPRGCLSSASVNVTTPDQTPPSISASGSLILCFGDSVTLTSSRVGGNTWSTGATTNSIVVKTSGSYTVSHNDGTGCGTLLSSPVTVSVNSLPSASISGQPAICPGSTTTLTAAPSGYNYLWSTGAASNSIIVSSPGQVSVVVTDNNGCKATATTNTFLAAKPSPHITGNLGICPGGATTLSAGLGFATYTWSNGQTGVSSISVNAAGKYYVTVTNSFGCVGADTARVSELTPPTPFISGGLSLCGGPTTLNAGGGYSAYLWSTNETSQTINVNTAGVFSVTVTDIYGCSGSTSVTTAKDSLPATPGPISGNVNGVCNSPGTVFSISPVPNTTHYVWTPPAGTSIVSGQGSTSITLAFSSGFTSGDLVVAASNACGQSGSLNPRILPLQAKPANPTSITGATSGVCASTNRAYSTPAIANATSYSWTVPAGVTISGGQGTPGITVNITNSFVSGNICVKANNACGNSDDYCITITGAAATPGPITGPTALCISQRNVIYSIAPVSGATSYFWTVPDQATIVTGQGTTSINVNFGKKSGNVTVIARNACGNSSQKVLPVVVSNCVTRTTNGTNSTTVQQQRFTPEVIANDGGVNILGDMQMEWTLGEPAIESFSGNSKLYTQGFHQPIVLKSTKADGIVLQSNDDLKIIAAPNPVQYTLSVRFTSKKEENLVLRLTEMSGKVLFTRPLRGSSGTVDIDMSSYSGGMYLLNIQSVNDGFSRNIKVVKVN